MLTNLPEKTINRSISQAHHKNGLRRVIKGQTTLEEMLRVLAIDQL